MKFSIVLLSALTSCHSFAADSNNDNTKVNKRDRAASEVTADQQTNSERDLNITQRIRQNIMKEKNFSINAQNVKVIAVDGKVTLKGPVNSASEQDRILKHARAIAGTSNVTNEMSIASQ
jgi:hyperosmotically inducible periplasmic protein